MFARVFSVVVLVMAFSAVAYAQQEPAKTEQAAPAKSDDAAMKERIAALEKQLAAARQPQLTPEQQAERQTQAYTREFKRFAELAGPGCAAVRGTLVVSVTPQGVTVSCEIRK